MIAPPPFTYGLTPNTKIVKIFLGDCVDDHCIAGETGDIGRRQTERNRPTQRGHDGRSEDPVTHSEANAAAAAAYERVNAARAALNAAEDEAVAADAAVVAARANYVDVLVATRYMGDRVAARWQCDGAKWAYDQAERSARLAWGSTPEAAPLIAEFNAAHAAWRMVPARARHRYLLPPTWGK